MSTAHYDVAVIGGGPGGYTAALYCARSGRSVVVLEKLSAGGQMATTDQVDNYPGFDEGINGFELAERMGYYAVNLLLSEKSGRIVCLQGADIVDYDIGEALAMHKSIDETLYAIAQAAAT